MAPGGNADLEKLQVNNLASPTGGAPPLYKLAVEAFKQLERLLLGLLLMKGIGIEGIKVRLNMILKELSEPLSKPLPKPLPSRVNEIARFLLLNKDEENLIRVALDCELYKKSGPDHLKTALRHILVRLNMFALAATKGKKDTKLVGSKDLVFNINWTTEHIFPQTPLPVEGDDYGDGDSAVLIDFFKPAVGEKPLHKLGNLAPLDIDLQNEARN